MVEKVKKIPARLLEIWNKFTSKQKTIIISVVLVVALTIGLLSAVISKPQYITLKKCDSTKEASQVVDILDSDGTIRHRESEDGLTIEVRKEDRADALLLLGKEGIPKIGMSQEELLKNDLGSTEDERQLKSKLYSQDDLSQLLTKYDGVKEAIVRIGDKEVDNTVLAETKERTASVVLTTTDKFDTSLAESIANIVAGAIGNETTDKIKVSNQQGILFTGSDNTVTGNAGAGSDVKSKIINKFENRLASQIQSQGFSDANVMANLAINMDKVNEVSTMYKPEQDQKGGYIDSESNYEATGANASGGVPGTDSNGDDTTYNIQDNGTSESQVKSSKTQYRFSSVVTNTDREMGLVDYPNSTVNIVLKRYKVIKETDLKKQGLLKGTTFEQYVADNSQSTPLTVDEALYAAVSAATGIPNNTDAISIQAYEEPVFQASESSFKITNYLMIILAVLIIALLIFVVFKGTAPVEVTELEPELSVEQLLATTKENQSLEDIEFSDKSETRKMIEKFVDENPDAVAQLLRNWLNEDWG